MAAEMSAAGTAILTLLRKLGEIAVQASPKLSKLKPCGRVHMRSRLTSVKPFMPVITSR